MTQEIKLQISFILLILIMVGMFIGLIFFIIKMVKNERMFKEFRKNLKVGDETDEGVVIAINGYNVYTEKVTRIETIKPYGWNTK